MRSILAARVVSALPVVGIASIAGSRFALKAVFVAAFPEYFIPNILHPTFRASCILTQGMHKPASMNDNAWIDARQQHPSRS